MSTPPDAFNHEHADTLIDDYVMGTLSPEDQEWMDGHLATCEICQETLPELLDAVQALPFGAPEPPVAMRDDLWIRIEAAIAEPARSADSGMTPPHQVVEMRPPPTMQILSSRWMLSAAALLVAVICGVLLAQVLPKIGGDSAKSQDIAFAFTDPDVSASGQLRYLPDEQVFVFSVPDMPVLPEGQVYQAWLIEGDKPPVPVGVMNAETGEVVAAGDRDTFDTFALTVEPGPLGSPAPTSKPIVVAPLHAEDAM